MLNQTVQKEILTNHRLPLFIGLLGILASFVLLFYSTGSNDIHTWQGFATEIRTLGLFQIYKADELFNHPPLMGIMAWQLLEISILLGVPFPFVFKLVPVLANVAAAIFLGVMWSRKADLRRGMWAFALFSWALGSVLVAAHHGNTDCLMAFLCLLALYFLEQKRPGLPPR